MTDIDPLISNLYSFFDLTGVLLYGIIGGTIARHRKFDLVGFVFLALFSALGGGMVRDSLMQKGHSRSDRRAGFLNFGTDRCNDRATGLPQRQTVGTVQGPCGCHRVGYMSRHLHDHRPKS